MHQGRVKPNRVWASSLGPLLFFLALGATLWIGFLPISTLLRTDFLYDDAFYYFKIADHVASGLGFSFDGIHPTNGFHPLWQLILVPLFFLLRGISWGPDLQIRLVLIMQSLLFAFTAWILFRISEELRWPRRLGVLLVIVWSFSPMTWNITMSGMEGGIAALFLALSIYRSLSYLRGSSQTVRQGLTLGLCFAAAMLSRLDLLVALIPMLAVLWLKLPGARSDRCRKMIFVFLPMLCFGILYLLWNRLAFGTWTPISGQVKAWHGLLVWQELLQSPWQESLGRIYLYALQYNLELRTFLYDRTVPIILALLQKAIGVSSPRWIWDALVSSVVFAFLFWTGRKWIMYLHNPVLLSFFLGTGINWLTQKCLYPSEWMPWFWVSGAVAGALFTVAAVKGLGDKIAERFRNKMWIPNLLLVLTGMAFIGNAAVVAYARIQRQNTALLPLHEASVGKELDLLVPENALVGSWNAGRVGFFTERTIINLDGLVNTYDYFREYLIRDAVRQYLTETKVDYLLDYVTVDSTETEFRLLPESWRNEYRPVQFWNVSEQDGRVKRWELWKRIIPE